MPLEYDLTSWLFGTTSPSSMDVVNDAIAATISSIDPLNTAIDSNLNQVSIATMINNHDNTSSSPSSPLVGRNCSDTSVTSSGAQNNISHDNYTMVVDLAGEYPLDQATILFGYITPFVVLLSIMTNLFVVAVLTRRHMRTGTNIILCTLSMVDLSTILIGSPWYFYIYTLGHYKDNLNWFTCYSHSVFIEGLPVFLHNASIWLTLLLAGQRYFCIRYPVLACRWCTKPRIKQSIGCIIVGAFVSQLTRFFDNEFVFDFECNQCKRTIARWVLHFGTDIYFGTYFLFRILFVYLIPCVSLVTLNCLLYLALKRAERKRTELLGPRYELEEVGWDVTLKGQPSPVLVPIDSDNHNNSVGCCGELASSAELRADTSTCTLDINDSTNPLVTEQPSTNQDGDPNNTSNKTSKPGRPQTGGSNGNVGVNSLTSSRLKWADPVDGKFQCANNNNNQTKTHNHINDSDRNNKLGAVSSNIDADREADRYIVEPRGRLASRQQPNKSHPAAPKVKAGLLINLAATDGRQPTVGRVQPTLADPDDENEMLDSDAEDPDEESAVEDEEQAELVEEHDLDIVDGESLEVGLSKGLAEASYGHQRCSGKTNPGFDVNLGNCANVASPALDPKGSTFLAKSLHWVLCKIFFCHESRRKRRRGQQLSKTIKQFDINNSTSTNSNNNNNNGSLIDNINTIDDSNLVANQKVSGTNCATTKTTTTTNLDTGTVTTKRRPKRVRDSNRTTLMLIVVVTVYLVIEIPSAIVTTLHTIASALNETSEQNDFVFNMANYTKLYSNFLIILSYSLNFSIYCSMSKKFRITFRDLVTCQSYGRQQRRRKQNGDHQHNLSQQLRPYGSSFRTGCIDSQYSTSPTGSRSQI